MNSWPWFSLVCWTHHPAIMPMHWALIVLLFYGLFTPDKLSFLQHNGPEGLDSLGLLNWGLKCMTLGSTSHTVSPGKELFLSSKCVCVFVGMYVYTHTYTYINAIKVPKNGPLSFLPFHFAITLVDVLLCKQTKKQTKCQFPYHVTDAAEAPWLA